MSVFKMKGQFSAGCGGWELLVRGGGASDDLAAARWPRGTEQAVPGAPASLDVDRNGLLAQR